MEDLSKIDFSTRLRELSEQLSTSEVQVLQYLKSDAFLLKAQERLESQAPKTEEILSQYSKFQYIQQTVEVMPGLKATFRTIPPWAMDESIDFANSRKKSNDNATRILARRRLSYALIEVNGEPMGKMAPEGSYFEFLRSDRDKFKEILTDYANEVYEFLNFYGLAEKLSEAFGLWEQIVFNRLNGIDDVSETLKKSTGGSGKEQ